MGKEELDLSFYKDPIIVFGVARSGTSMTCGILNLCGAFGGKMYGENKHNQRGMFENIDIRQNLVKPYLKSKGLDPLGQVPLMNDEQRNAITQEEGEEWRKALMESMVRQGLEPGQTWFYKCAKGCFFWPLWKYAFPKSKCVIVRREDRDIARSCIRTGFMRAHTTEDGWLSWIDQHKQRFKEMHDSGMEIREVWPSKMIQGDFTEVIQVMEWLGLEWNNRAAKEFIAPALWNRGRA
jgi:hypothetical protein